MFELPALPYAHNSLEPHIDEKTMEIHHGKHHQAYVNNLNNAVKGNAAEGVSLIDLVHNISKYSPAIRNNGGGHWNHSFFWGLMGPNAGGQPTGALMDAIVATFGSFDAMLLFLSLSALYMQAKKWIQNWILWIVVDLIYVPVYWLNHNYITAFLYLIYIPIAVKGYQMWKNESKQFSLVERNTID